MLLFNKRKKQQTIIDAFYGQTQTNIIGLHRILHKHGADQFIQANKDRFYAYSFFFLSYCQEVALISKYGKQYNAFATEIVPSLIIRFSERFGYVPQKMSDIYLTIRNQLAEAAFDERVKAVGLYYGFACHYLIAVLPEEYDPDNADVYFELATFFQSRVNKNVQYLSSIT